MTVEEWNVVLRRACEGGKFREELAPFFGAVVRQEHKEAVLAALSAFVGTRLTGHDADVNYYGVVLRPSRALEERLLLADLRALAPDGWWDWTTA